MNIAIIFAGGVGERMNSRSKPKQFLKLHGKPILVHTVEIFQQHEMIDGIVISCVESWMEYCKKLVQKYQLSKVDAIVAGGITGQESIYHGLIKAMELYPRDSIALIHDGVRPLIDYVTIAENIECVKRFGNSITVSPAIETVSIKNECDCIEQILDRSKCLIAKAPQSFILNDITEIHNQAIADGNLQFLDSASMMQHYGKTLHIVEGPAYNIKITTPTDFYLFRALVDAKENSQIFGL